MSHQLCVVQADPIANLMVTTDMTSNPAKGFFTTRDLAEMLD